MSRNKKKPTANQLLEHINFIDTKLNASYSNLKTYTDTLNAIFLDFLEFKGETEAFNDFIKKKYPKDPDVDKR